MAELKESFPVQVAEYAIRQEVDHEPAFNWWVTHVLKKRDRIIALVKQQGDRYWKRTHKYGIEIPKNWKDCKRIDDENGNTMWQDAVAKEMGVVKVLLAFDIGRWCHSAKRVPED